MTCEVFCSLPSQSTLCGSLCLCTVDGRALGVGGMGADLLPRNILQQYDLRKDVWALLPPMATPRYDANTYLLSNKLYVAGEKKKMMTFNFPNWTRTCTSDRAEQAKEILMFQVAASVKGRSRPLSCTTRRHAPGARFRRCPANGRTEA